MASGTGTDIRVIEISLLDDIFALRSLLETLRVKRDRLNRGTGAREVATAITRGEECEMWLERACACFGE